MKKRNLFILFWLFAFAMMVLTFGSCGQSRIEKQRELGESVIRAVHDSWAIKSQRDKLIKFIIERENLDTLTWVTSETVDSLIEVVKGLPPCSDLTLSSVVYSPEDAGPYPEEKLKKVSYKVEYKRHVEIMDSICKNKNPCSESLGFAETFNHQNASKPHHVEDFWHPDILITIP